MGNEGKASTMVTRLYCSIVSISIQGGYSIRHDSSLLAIVAMVPLELQIYTNKQTNKHPAKTFNIITIYIQVQQL